MSEGRRFPWKVLGILVVLESLLFIPPFLIAAVVYLGLERFGVLGDSGGIIEDYGYRTAKLGLLLMGFLYATTALVVWIRRFEKTTHDPRP